MKTIPDSSVSADGGLVDLLGVDQAVDLLLEQDRAGLANGHPPGLRLLGHDLLEHALEIHLHLLHVPRPQDRDGAMLRPGIVTSTSRSSSSPDSSRFLIFSRDRCRRSAASSACGESTSPQVAG